MGISLLSVIPSSGFVFIVEAITLVGNLDLSVGVTTVGEAHVIGDILAFVQEPIHEREHLADKALTSADIEGLKGRIVIVQNQFAELGLA